MRYIFYIIFICINFSCLNVKTTKITDCTTEYLTYYNYDGATILNEIKYIPNLKKIDDKSFNSYLENGVDFEEIKQHQIIFLSRGKFFNSSNLKGNIPLYIIGYFQNNTIKQYLVLEPDLGQNLHLYIINEVKDKSTSMFLAHSNYNAGFGSESVETKRLSNYIFQIRVYYTFDTTDIKRNSFGKCNSVLRLSTEGYLKPTTDAISDK